MLQALRRVPGVALGDPIVVVAAGLLLLAGAAFAGWWIVRNRLETPADRLCRVLAAREEVVVLMHPNPDPDAMASAMAVAHLADEVDTAARIQYSGSVKHPENRAFETVFGLELEAIQDTGGLACEDVVLVDHNEPRGFAGAGALSPLVVVDHHPGVGGGTAFTDVRPEYGACSTILAEYLRDRAGGGSIPDELATALLYGVQSDTKSLTRGCSGAEFEASSYLHRHADVSLLDRVATPAVPAEYLDVQARAITERRVELPYAISDVGDVATVDAIAGAADELLRLEGVRAVVVFGTKDGTLHLSGRSRDENVHVGRALRDAVDDIPMASAGGHARMGGGQLSLPHMNGLGPGDGVTRGELHDLLFDALRSEA